MLILRRISGFLNPSQSKQVSTCAGPITNPLTGELGSGKRLLEAVETFFDGPALTVGPSYRASLTT